MKIIMYILWTSRSLITFCLLVLVSSKGFYKEQEMVEFMCEFLWMRPRELEDRSFELQRDQRMKLEREIKGEENLLCHV